MGDSPLKICLIGSFSRELNDEGHTNIGLYLSAQLRKKYPVLELDGYRMLHCNFWKDLRYFTPDIIHFIPGITIQSFIFLRLLKQYTSTKTIISAVNPRLYSLNWKFVSLFKPDLILNQSHEIERLSNHLGIKTRFLPNGVDIKKFTPITIEEKSFLREKYRIDKDKFIILHVGHLTSARRLEPLYQLNSSDQQVLIIGSSYMKTNQAVRRTLDKKGCIVWSTYFSNIQEIYQLSDCYVFPTPQHKAILQPLSVLEAMACNLPVVTTKLNGLSMLFPLGEINGLFYMDELTELGPLVNRARNTNNIKTRQAVLPYSWERVASIAEDIYNNILNQEK